MDSSLLGLPFLGDSAVSEFFDDLSQNVPPAPSPNTPFASSSSNLAFDSAQTDYSIANLDCAFNISSYSDPSPGPEPALCDPNSHYSYHAYPQYQSSYPTSNREMFDYNAHEQFFDFGTCERNALQEPTAPTASSSFPPAEAVDDPYHAKNYFIAHPSAPLQQEPAAHTPSIYNAFRAAPESAPVASKNTSTPVASAEPVLKAKYKREKGKTSQMCRQFPDHLPEENNRGTHQVTGKEQYWFFVLKTLLDVTKKEIVVWTGEKRHFRVENPAGLCRLWSAHNGLSRVVQWESLRKLMRDCGKNGILMAVPAPDHAGRNVPGEFGYVIEPAFYVGMTRQQLDEFIRRNCEPTPPARKQTRGPKKRPAS